MRIHFAGALLQHFGQLFVWLHRGLLLAICLPLSGCLLAWGDGAIAQIKAPEALHSIDDPLQPSAFVPANTEGRVEINRLDRSIPSQVTGSDGITVRARYGAYRYQVDSLSAANPAAVSVLGRDVKVAPTTATRYSFFYPFFFAGLKPQRFIIHAERLP